MKHRRESYLGYVQIHVITSCFFHGIFPFLPPRGPHDTPTATHAHTRQARPPGHGLSLLIPSPSYSRLAAVERPREADTSR